LKRALAIEKRKVGSLMKANVIESKSNKKHSVQKHSFKKQGQSSQKKFERKDCASILARRGIKPKTILARRDIKPKTEALGT